MESTTRVSSWWNGVRRQLRRSWGADVDDVGDRHEGGRLVDPTLRAAFEEHARQKMARRFPSIAAVVGCAVIIWWPLDWVLWSDDDAVLGGHVWMRGLILAVCSAFWLLSRYTDIVERYPTLSGSLTVFVATGLGAASIANVAPPGSAMAALGLVLPFLTVVYIGPLGTRTLLAMGIAAAFICGLLIPTAVHLDLGVTGTFLSQSIFASCLAIVTGHLLHTVTLASYVQGRKLEEQSARLADVNVTLEETVRAKTEDLRLLARRLDTIVEEERLFMAREIHDELGQELTAMRYALAFALRKCNNADPTLRARLDEVESLLGRTRETMRRIVGRLRPRVLDELGLTAAAEWALGDVAARAGLTREFRAPEGDLGLSLREATTLFRILQEALTNVAKHADAQSVRVSLRRDPGEVRLVVEDDGAGLREGWEVGQGVGMIGMRERAAEHGGAVSWTPRDGGGLRVETRLPIGGRGGEA